MGNLYKILAKLIASRLKRVLGSLISKYQTAFVSSRQLLDGVVVANKIIYLATRRKNECMLFKVDFEKAYDCELELSKYMMKKTRFRYLWLNLMEACVFNSHLYVLVNGSHTNEFNVGKGLRQGDPLSHFLFVLVVDALYGLVN